VVRTRKRSADELQPARRPDTAPRPRVELVRKRDGRVVPFQRQKIADAVAKAMEAAGELDARFAAEVAGIVELTLLERAEQHGSSTSASGTPEAGGSTGAAIPHIETIQDLVERALMELGKSAVAKAYILHRDLRARVRAVLRVHRSDTLRAPVRVREREGVSDWSKGRIVAALMQEAELPREAAEDVAGAVERRVFAAGKKSVTTGLIRELVASELFERGWLAALTATRVVGLPRIDVRRVLTGQTLHPWRALRPRGPRGADAAPAADVLAGELLARYALESVLSDAAGELHRAGDVHVVGLESLGRPLTLCVEAELLCGGGDPARSAHAMLDELAALVPRVARVLVLERPASVLAPLVRTTREHSPHGLAAWIRGLAAIARAGRVRIDLGSPGARYHASSARLVEELAELEGEHAPRLYLEGPELEALLEARADLQPAVARLLAAGRLLPAWSSPEGTFAGPGCERRPDERGLVACGGAIALNLPRIARRAGPFREELFQSALAELVQAAVEIAGALRAQQTPSAGVRARIGIALVPVGLREALRILGDGAIDVDLAARTLGFLGEAAHRYGRDGTLERLPTPFFGAEAAARFAFLDARALQQDGARQEWLFDAAEAALGEVRPYSTGFVLSPAGALASGRAEAEALRTVPSGALDLSPFATGATGATSEHAALDAWRRFEVVHRSHTGELVLELFPREPRAPRLRPLV
jgi:transcriptional regulator NrdR family protein